MSPRQNALASALRRGEWDLAALALLVAAAGALDSLPPQAASGLVETLSDEVVCHPHPLYPPLLQRRGGKKGPEGAKPLRASPQQTPGGN